MGTEERFLQDMLASGISPKVAQYLREKLPANWNPDHREVYFDFGLGRWMKHLEPETLSKILGDILESAPSIHEGRSWIIQALEALVLEKSKRSR